MQSERLLAEAWHLKEANYDLPPLESGLWVEGASRLPEPVNGDRDSVSRTLSQSLDSEGLSSQRAGDQIGDKFLMELT